MEQEEKEPKRTYVLGRMQNVMSGEQATFKYIAYPKAMQFLANRLKATPEELAVWIFFGPTQGGLTAYTNANELDPPPTFYFGYHSGVANYIGPLMACWFKEEDIENFQPAERYITGKDLIDRWGHYSGTQPENFILAKIRESRLVDVHPTFGGTKGTFSEKENFPPLESGLFSMAQIEEIEWHDFGVVSVDSVMKKSRGHLNFDPDLQDKANEIAGKFLVDKNRHPTKSEVAKLLAREVDISIESLLRRIRVKWKKQ